MLKLIIIYSLKYYIISLLMTHSGAIIIATSCINVSLTLITGWQQIYDKIQQWFIKSHIYSNILLMIIITKNKILNERVTIKNIKKW